MLPAAHGRLRAQNTHLGIGETGTELALTAAPNGGYIASSSRVSVAERDGPRRRLRFPGPADTAGRPATAAAQAAMFR